jgi:hypothetical protein
MRNHLAKVCNFLNKYIVCQTRVPIKAPSSYLILQILKLILALGSRTWTFSKTREWPVLSNLCPFHEYITSTYVIVS